VLGTVPARASARIDVASGVDPSATLVTDPFLALGVEERSRSDLPLRLQFENEA
jgi:hypothetical protein